MNRQCRFLLILLLALGCIQQSSCFKKDFAKVGSPDDIDLKDTLSAPADSSIVKKVLVIGIDGCRADAMKTADAPNILGLLQNAVYSFDAQTQAPTLSGPGWSSMLTGVWGNKHGVTDNTFSGSQFDKYPAFYKYISSLTPTKSTTSIVSWNPINDFIALNATKRIDLSENDNGVKDSAVYQLKNANPDLLFLHFDQVDEAGHQYGFSPDVPEYMTAIHQVDGLVGEVMNALNARVAVGKKEDWLVVISTDHGGIGTSHGGSSNQETNIFTIFYNKNFAAKNVVPPLSVLRATAFTNTGSGSYANLTNYYNLDTIPKLSFQFEIKTSQLNSDVPFLANKNWASGANPGFVFNIASQSWKINIADSSKRRIDINATGVPNLNDNLWHRLTVTLDRSGDITIYQDGLKCGSTSIAGLTNITTSSPVKLAINNDNTGNYTKSNFAISNIKIWSDVLDPTYVALQNCDTSLSASDPYKDKLLSWWKCDDGEGDKFKDAGSGGYDFQLYGSPAWTVQNSDFCNNNLPPSVPTIVDIMPTVMSWLGYSVDYSGWQLDGRSWLP